VSQPSASVFFTDGKAPDAMRTIGEVAAGFGIKQHILRYWEQQFPMLRPLKRSGGRRLYRPEDVALVAEIDRLINLEGYTLKGARQVIENGGQAEGETLVREAAPQSADVLDRLKAVRARLSGALAAA
jgi:DNA-binding transcriptional MerR regulator